MDHFYLDYPTINPEYPSNDSPTVIVGAGIVGLCTAYFLALESHRSDQLSPNVTVIDVINDPFGSTSSHNTGIIFYHEFVDDPKGLRAYSCKLWKMLAQDMDSQILVAVERMRNSASILYWMEQYHLEPGVAVYGRGP